jgi:hypothetical protein
MANVMHLHELPDEASGQGQVADDCVLSGHGSAGIAEFKRHFTYLLQAGSLPLDVRHPELSIGPVRLANPVPPG